MINHDSLFRARRRLRGHRRVARKHGLPACASMRDYRRALRYFGYRCAVCGQPLWNENGGYCGSIDCWIPMRRGGGVVPQNIVPMCQPCNAHKACKLPLDWLLETRGTAEGRMIYERVERFLRTQSR